MSFIEEDSFVIRCEITLLLFHLVLLFSATGNIAKSACPLYAYREAYTLGVFFHLVLLFSATGNIAKGACPLYAYREVNTFGALLVQAGHHFS